MKVQGKNARIPPAGVTAFIKEAVIKAGVPAADAGKLAELMLEADLIGADAHGVFRLPQYVQRLKFGSTNAKPNITVKKTAPAVALVDGDNGMGHLVVARAAELAVEMARECGVAWVGCRMSGHAGAAGVYAALPLKSDMIGIYSAVANANHMPLAGGAEPLLGTNPLAIVRGAVTHPTAVLLRAGVSPVVRDDFAEANFPDDIYDLSPAAFSDIDDRLHEPGLRWGAAKAHTHLRRRRQDGMR